MNGIHVPIYNDFSLIFYNDFACTQLTSSPKCIEICSTREEHRVHRNSNRSK